MLALRIAALILIWIGATAAWMVLGATLLYRSEQAGDTQRRAIGTLWLPEQTQSAPVFSVTQGKLILNKPPDASTVDVALALDQRRKGLIWFNTYRVDFSGAYRVRNNGNGQHVGFALRLPADNAVYDDVKVLVNGAPVADPAAIGVIDLDIPVAPGRVADVVVSYRSRGVGRWSYKFGPGVNVVRDFDLTMRTDFDAIDFPEGTLTPTAERKTPTGWDLVWSYRDLVAGYGIGMRLPERLQPGLLAQRITFWAPLSLLFYFFVIFVITTIRRIELHPMNYFFLAAAFFSFHLLFAYTVDRLPIGTAFAICSVVSMFLTITYLRLVVGLRFAAVEAGLAQVFYLILFSLALFNEGTSGLAITIGAIITLFLTMQLTARIDWSGRFAQASPKSA
jgi:hypothetical protein